MDIAIIGSGNVGKALAAAAVRNGHNVTLSAANPAHARAAAESIGARAAESNLEAVEGAELVVLAVYSTVVVHVLDEIIDALAGKILVDPTNPMTDDAYGPALEGDSGAEFIQKYVPEARVVKAFNTVFAGLLANPVIDGIQLDGFVAADEEAAKKTVLQLVQSFGLRPIDAGQLTMARALEAMSLLNIQLQIRNGWPWGTAWKLLGPVGA
jgi:NADPH-dependent F420 reductase